MRDFPSCFAQNAVLVADSSSAAARTAQNLVTCIYKSRICADSCIITVTWSKNLMGQGFSVGIDHSTNQNLCRVDIKPWLLSKRKGSKIFYVDDSQVGIFWDLSSAKFGSGPEPLVGFYLAIVFDGEMALLLGDLSKEAYRKTNARPPHSTAQFISKREHIFGKRMYCTKAQFFNNGIAHDVAIECETVGLKDPCLSICIDKKPVMQVNHLTWKFRGNQTILVDGLLIEVFWDVYNWLFGTAMGSAVFLFQSCLSAEKAWSGSHTSELSVLPWSCAQIFRETQLQGPGFSLILYAWKSE